MDKSRRKTSWHALFPFPFTLSIRTHRRKKAVDLSETPILQAQTLEDVQVEKEEKESRPGAYRVPSAIVAATERGMISAAMCRMGSQEGGGVLTRGEEALVREEEEGAKGPRARRERCVRFKGVDV